MNTLAFRAMGSQIHVWGEGDLSIIPQQIEALEAQLSRFRPASELSQLNRLLGQWVSISEVMYHNLEQVLHMAEQTDGLVSPLILNALIGAGYEHDFISHTHAITEQAPKSVPDWREIRLERHRVWLPAPIDLGGIAKGWTAQHIAANFEEILVDMGGDIVAKGKQAWRIELADPLQAQKPFAILLLQDCAVATSGIDYRRWGNEHHHLIDPRTALPAQSDVLSATLIHPDMVWAEALAKAVLLQGSLKGLQWLNQYPKAAGLVFCQDGRVLASSNFQEFII